MAVASTEEGIAALRQDAGLWKRGRISETTARIASAAIICPIESKVTPTCIAIGEELAVPVNASSKLRPIACPECLLKFAETTIILDQRQYLLDRLQPLQLGVGTPDACPIVVSIIQAWAQYAANIATRVTLGLDEENAYGRFYRSQALWGALDIYVHQYSCCSSTVAIWQQYSMAKGLRRMEANNHLAWWMARKPPCSNDLRLQPTPHYD